MEMTWMETFQLLGLDLLAVMLVTLVGLEIVEHAVHAVWQTARSRRPRDVTAVARRQSRPGVVRHA
jgi:hypothetical protein